MSLSPMSPLPMSQPYPVLWNNVNALPHTVVTTQTAAFDPSRIYQSYLPHGLLNSRPSSVPDVEYHQHTNGAKRPSKQSDVGKHLVQAASFVGVVAMGLLLRRGFPYSRHQPAISTWFSTDWKDMASVVLGMVAVNRFNHAADIKPQPWVSALEALAVIGPLTSRTGLSGTLKHMGLMAPLVAGTVALTTWLGQHISPKLEEDWGVPQPVTRLALATVMTLLGVRAYRPLAEGLLKRGFLEPAQAGASGSSVLAACSDGCGAVVCFTEIGEMVNGMLTWIKHKPNSHQEAH